MRRETLRRLATAGAVVAATTGLINVSAAIASGFGQGNFNDAGQVGSHGPHGYSPAPAILDTSAGPVTVTYAFTVHRYTGPNHIPFDQPIDVDLALRVRHVVSIDGIKDPGLKAGDPGLPASADHPAWDEAFLDANAPRLNETLINATVLPSSHFSVKLPALPSFTTAAEAMEQTQDFSFQVTIPRCGYFQIQTGAFTANTAPGGGDQGPSGPPSSCSCPPAQSSGGGGTRSGGDYFTVLNRGFVRAVSSTCATAATPTPTAGVQGTTSAPTSTPSGGSGGLAPTPTASVLGVTTGVPKVTGAVAPTPATGLGFDPHFYYGMLLLGLGGVLAAVATGIRRTEAALVR